MLTATIIACGGSAKPAAQSSGGGSVSSESDESPESDAAEAEVAAPRLPTCDDGTCFPCGDTICMSGFYCDASAPGGPACSWLPACTQRGMCTCLKRELGATCSCEEKNGGTHVTCS